MGTAAHREYAGHDPVTVAIVTVSDSRTPETDTNRQYIEKRMAELGHKVAAYRLIKDEPDQVADALNQMAALPEVRLILFNGGTGISPRDTTFDVISRMLEKTLPGFGELFRMFSYQEVGAAAMLSRATAGVYQKTLVFSMPGSPNAVQVALEKLILPEINHLAWEVVRKMIRRFIQAVPLALIAIFAVAGFLGLRALLWRQEYQAVALMQTGLLLSIVVSAVVGAGYVLMGSLLWRLLNLDWLSLQFGSILGALLYGGYNALTPLTPLSTGEIPLWRGLQGGMDGLLIGIVIGALVMTVSQQPLHLDRGGLLRYLILYITVILLAWLVLLMQTLLHLPPVVGAVVVVPLLIVLRLAVAWLDRRADTRAYRYDEGR